MGKWNKGDIPRAYCSPPRRPHERVAECNSYLSKVLLVRAKTRGDIDTGLRTAVQKVAGTTKAKGLRCTKYDNHRVIRGDKKPRA